MLTSIKYLLLILIFSVGNLLIAEDKIRAGLDSALSKYDATVSESREEVISFFDKQITTARKKGDARQVAAISEKREQFEKIGKVPEGLPRQITSKLARERQRLAEAYKAAISAYTKASQDEAAKALQQEYDEFLASGDFGSQSDSIPLFNAKDLTGWRGLPAMCERTVKCTLTGSVG